MSNLILAASMAGLGGVLFGYDMGRCGYQMLYTCRLCCLTIAYS